MASAAVTAATAANLKRVPLAGGALSSGSVLNTVLPPPHPWPAASALALGPLRHVAHYSDKGGVITHDLASLRRFREPAVPRLLTEGKWECMRRNRKNHMLGHPVPLDRLLEACASFGELEAVRKASVVTWRGVIRKIMSGDHIDVHVSLIDGVLYLVEVDKHPGMVYLGQIEEGYHGYAFEALCTAEDQDAPIKVDTRDIWKCIVSRKLGDLNLVYGAEVDCIEGEYYGDSTGLMELKTLLTDSSHRSYKRKWFLQSHLLDIPELAIGHRDASHVLQRVERVRTASLAPAPDVLCRRYAAAHAVLHALRHSCALAQESGPGDDAVWRASLGKGQVRAFRLLEGEEVARLRTQTRATGRRLGLVPARWVAEMRACAPSSEGAGN